MNRYTRGKRAAQHENRAAGTLPPRDGRASRPSPRISNRYVVRAGVNRATRMKRVHDDSAGTREHLAEREVNRASPRPGPPVRQPEPAAHLSWSQRREIDPKLPPVPAHGFAPGQWVTIRKKGTWEGKRGWVRLVMGQVEPPRAIVLVMGSGAEPWFELADLEVEE